MFGRKWSGGNFNPHLIIFPYVYGFVVLVGAVEKWRTANGRADSRHMWQVTRCAGLHMGWNRGRVIHTSVWMESDRFVYFIHRFGPKLIYGRSQKVPPIYGGCSFGSRAGISDKFSVLSTYNPRYPQFLGVYPQFWGDLARRFKIGLKTGLERHPYISGVFTTPFFSAHWSRFSSTVSR